MMNSKIKSYINNLFKDAPKNMKSYELKEELLSNVTDKYNDLLDMGVDEVEAYKKAISSIGNIEDIVKESRDYLKEEREYRKKSGIRVSIAVMMYILCPIPTVIMSDRGHNLEILGVSILLTMVAIATGILIYNGYDKPINRKIDDDLYDEFLEWKQTYKEDNLFNVINNTIWLITVAIYLIVSFAYNNWHVSWVIFILGGVIKSIVNSIFIYNKKE